jgi:hypothetical protein
MNQIRKIKKNKNKKNSSVNMRKKERMSSRKYREG